jgi:hypothetical protein
MASDSTVRNARFKVIWNNRLATFRGCHLKPIPEQDGINPSAQTTVNLFRYTVPNPAIKWCCERIPPLEYGPLHSPEECSGLFLCTDSDRQCDACARYCTAADSHPENRSISNLSCPIVARVEAGSGTSARIAITGLWLNSTYQPTSHVAELFVYVAVSS